MTKQQVLVMEDEPLVAEAIRVCLENAGYAVVVASDGEEGLQRWEQQGANALVIDHQMPKRSGLDVMRAIRKQGSLPPTIVVSGLGQEDVAAEAFRLGAEEYISKGVGAQFYDILPHALERILIERQAREQANVAQEEQARLLLELKGRIKEVGCLYGTESLLAEVGDDTSGVLESLVELIGHAWTHDDLSEVRIRSPEGTFETKAFKETAWMQSAEMLAAGHVLGTIDIAYREKPPAAQGDIFTPEETELLRAIADRLGRFLAQRNTEKKLVSVHDELRKLSRAVEQSASGVVITDPEGAIEYVNPRFTKMAGYTAAEVLGKNPRMLKSGEMDSSEYGALWKTIKSGENWTGEFHNRKKNGELYWDHSTISSVSDATGKITHFVAVKEDFTERKRAEAWREAVLNISAFIAGCQTEDEICRVVVEGIREHMNVDRCGLFLGETDNALFRGTYGTDVHGRTISERDVMWDIKQHLDVVELFDGAPYKSGFPLGSPIDVMPGEETLFASLIALRQAGKLFGIISVDNRMTRRTITDMQLAHIAMLAEVIGNALQAARAREALRRSKEKLERAYEELDQFNQAMIGREGRVIELKEEVNELLAAIGKPLRYPPVWEEGRGVRTP